jgi:hypothetical protein
MQAAHSHISSGIWHEAGRLQKEQLRGGENLNEKNEPNPVQKAINRLSLNRINIKDISGVDHATKYAIGEINEALIALLESV